MRYRKLYNNICISNYGNYNLFDDYVFYVYKDIGFSCIV